MCSVEGYLHIVSCSKALHALSSYCINPLGTEQEKSEIISSLCSPLSGCLMSTKESVSSGSALCITAVIQTNNWQFASRELINDVCFEVSESLEVVHCQTVQHLGLVVALLEHNHLTLEPYGQSLIRSGLSILDGSIKAANPQMIVSSLQMIHSIMKNLYLITVSSEIRRIAQATEKLQKDCVPEIRSGACQVAEIAAKLCSQMLMAGALSDSASMHSSPKNQFLFTPEEADLAKSCSAGCRKSGRWYPDKGCSLSSPGPYPLRRKLNYREELTGEHHSLFRCGLDSSEWTYVRDYAEEHKEDLVLTMNTPGSEENHESTTTCNELKLITRRSYQLLNNCHECGLTFAGNLSARNFVMDKYINMKFDETAKESVKKLEEEEGGDDKDEDKHAFVHMIKREVFDMKPVPSDLGTWLFLVDGCDASIEEVVKYSINLMDEHQIASTFTSLFDTLLDLEENDHKVYDAVIIELGEKPLYSNWQVLVNYTVGNSYLKDTFRYMIDEMKKTYKNNPRGLLLMLRNSRQHAAKFKEFEFARIVAEHFPDLMSDFQVAMHRQKCLSKLNLKYSVG